MTKNNADIIDDAVAQGGAYDVIRKRLTKQGKALKQLTQNLNEQRQAEFGGVEMQAIARTRVRTENNCIARDIVQVGDKLLFGYNVFIGLKKGIQVKDVFALFQLQSDEQGHELIALDIEHSFLYEDRFKSDFEELYRYYKEAKLIKLAVRNDKLIAVFQIGKQASDIRAFRWSISADGQTLAYIDNRGERDIQAPNQFDFEWIETDRDNFVHGKNPHVNIADTLFVETINGDLTIKIEDNTEKGLGIYSEPVEEENQSLDDASVKYAKLGDLLLLAVTPYKESTTRYFVFNALNEKVSRIDAIGDSCILLPEDHGIIFPGGYYLSSGESKSFPEEIADLRFERTIKSPNGEDVLYVFYEHITGTVALFSYNLISKSLQNPIYSSGYARYADGKLIVFSAEQEATRIHPMQIWQTSYVSAEFASNQPESTSDLGKIGNSELVRGISDLFSIEQLISGAEVSMRHYEELNEASKKIFDSHYWLDDSNNEAIANQLHEVTTTSELVIAEYEKVQSIQQSSKQALQDAKAQQRQLLSNIATSSWESAEQFINAIAQLRKQRGHIATIKEYRYINIEELDELDSALLTAEQALGQQTTQFLSEDDSLQSYTDKVADFKAAIETAQTNAEIRPVITQIEETTSGLDLLSELITTLKIDDTTVRTRIVDSISEVYAKLNQAKASGSQKQKGLGSEEAIAQFSAQFKLFSQSITNALGIANTPDKCDEQLAKLLVQLEDLESQFSEFDQFLADIMDKREEIYEAFETHKQSLIEARQRKAQSISDSAERILKSIEKRSLKLADSDALNTYFASDALVLKTKELVEQLRELNAEVAADDIQSRFKGLKEQAIRSLRDKTDIYEDDGKVIKLGPIHKFSVNQQDLDLTIIPRHDELYFHLIGTDYYEPVEQESLNDTRPYWLMSLESETPEVYRSETLAYLVIEAAKNEQAGLNDTGLSNAAKDIEQLTKLVRDFSTPYYKHGYQKGIHDSDAAKIIQAVLPAMESAGLLRFEPKVRGFAQVFWTNLNCLEGVDASALKAYWPQRAKSATRLQELFADSAAIELLGDEISITIEQFTDQFEFDLSQLEVRRSAQYLVWQLASNAEKFTQSIDASKLQAEFKRAIDAKSLKQFETSLLEHKQQPDQQWALACAWLEAVVNHKALDSLARYIPETAANIICSTALIASKAKLELTIDGLLGEHPTIKAQSLKLSLDEYLYRMDQHQRLTIPGFHRYLSLRNDLMKTERATLKLDSFKARPLSSFVRNRLVNESYLPIIGDNLAKQIGTIGDSKRTDLMGLLMMISPPGYGKTTLMEYIANRLGLIFMKINCPALGHDVLSLDPAQAPNSTARQELEKINFSFEMGNNVMLYLDDIQHTHSEFLQKFISLCDGTRRVEGVWRGQAKTYDMRGKKFCVVMAGNPYTESGEQFKVPDMLANRADIYNLGDILGGMEEQFSLSYIENSLTSNTVLAPLATRDMQDVYRLISISKGENIAATDLSHQYSAAEINEFTSVFKKLFTIQKLLLKVNQQYIASAAQDDHYRLEPPFKLQGSYRNMNKMAEKISAVMNQAELMQLIEDHYLGESQLLTTGTEENLLKLAQLRGNMTDQQQSRWQQIKADFLRNKALGGDGSDGNKIANQMINLVEGLEQLNSTLEGSSKANAAKLKTNQQNSLNKAKLNSERASEQHQALLKSLQAINDSLSKQQLPIIEVINQPSPAIVNTLDVLASSMDTSIRPLILSMEKKMDIDLRTLEKFQTLANRIEQVKDALVPKPRPRKKASKKRTTKKSI